jgi:hypothetical protein
MKFNRFKISLLTLVAALVVGVTSCGDPEDLVTENAKEGGMIVPVAPSLSYVLNNTPSLDMELLVPKGPGVSSIQVYKYYCSQCGDEDLAAESNEVLAATIDVAGANKSEDVTESLPLTYAQLREGLTIDGEALPEDENNLNIGDFWEFRFVTIMEDGRELINLNTVTVSVANLYSGEYQSTGVFNHPVAGPRDINRAKTLAPIDAQTVETEFADLGGSGWRMWLVVNGDNTVTLVPKGSASPGTVQFTVDSDDNTYNPETGIIKLRYKYAGSGGDRVVNETLTPND